MNNIPEIFYTKTIYGLRLPEFNQVVSDAMKSDVILKRHEKPWLKYQDDYHETFRETYIDWTEPLFKDQLDSFDYFYPSNGSSEAIKDVIKTFKTNTPNGIIHVFDGEYEGYEAYAKECDTLIMSHDRNSYEASLACVFMPQDMFILSQPSGVDGNVWKGFNQFMQFMRNQYPKCKLAIDLAYAPLAYEKMRYRDIPFGIPTTTKRWVFDPSNISLADYIFVSLSKTFGVYYNRIGGVFSKEPIGLLYGNQWFKNIDSLYIGEKLMQSFSLERISELFNDAITSARLGFYDIFHSRHQIERSDVPIIVNCSNKDLYPAEFTRLNQGKARLCISPYISESIERESLKA